MSRARDLANVANGNVDVAGDITLDAGGGEVFFQDDGTSVAYLSNSNTDLLIGVSNQDKDLYIQGNDGGGTINALQLDMSQAGYATFSNGGSFQSTLSAPYVFGNTDTDTGIALGANGADIMQFYAGNVERARITANGISFNGDTAAGNFLDDYEEGDYDVTVAPATSGTISLNGSYNRASYTKVGRLVTVNGFVIVDGVSSPTGYFTISIPFVVASLPDRAGDSAASLVIQNVASSNISDFVGTVNEGATSIAVQLGDGTTTQNDSAQQIAVNTYIMFNVTYSTT